MHPQYDTLVLVVHKSEYMRAVFTEPVMLDLVALELRISFAVFGGRIG
jgi:hypothetical protein